MAGVAIANARNAARLARMDALTDLLTWALLRDILFGIVLVLLSLWLALIFAPSYEPPDDDDERRWDKAIK